MMQGMQAPVPSSSRKRKYFSFLSKPTTTPITSTLLTTIAGLLDPPTTHLQDDAEDEEEGCREKKFNARRCTWQGQAMSSASSSTRCLFPASAILYVGERLVFKPYKGHMNYKAQSMLAL